MDLTKPSVMAPAPQYDAKANTLTILWQATDKNLGPQPIALCWSKDPAGPWVPIITQIQNTGRYVWKLPAGLPSRFWVQVEASDLAGNVATTVSKDAVALAPEAAPPAAAVVTVEAPEAKRQPARTPTLTLEPINE